MADDFRTALAAQLAELHNSLSVEYGNILVGLEARITASSAENDELRAMLGLNRSSCTAKVDTSEGLFDNDDQPSSAREPTLEGGAQDDKSGDDGEPPQRGGGRSSPPVFPNSRHRSWLGGGSNQQCLDSSGIVAESLNPTDWLPAQPDMEPPSPKCEPTALLMFDAEQQLILSKQSSCSAHCAMPSISNVSRPNSVAMVQMVNRVSDPNMPLPSGWPGCQRDDSIFDLGKVGQCRQEDLDSPRGSILPAPSCGGYGSLTQHTTSCCHVASVPKRASGGERDARGVLQCVELNVAADPACPSAAGELAGHPVPSCSRSTSLTTSGSGASLQSEARHNFALAPTWDTGKRRTNCLGGRSGRRKSSVLRAWTVNKTISAATKRSLGENACRLRSYNEHVSEDCRPRLLILIRERVPMLMVSPTSIKRLVWEAVSLLIVIYDLVLIPLEVFGFRQTDATAVMAWLARVWWSVDICLNYLTGYISKDGKLITDTRAVAWHYTTHQFPLDLIVVVAEWLEVMFESRAAGMLRSWRVIRILRMLRIKKARDMSNHILEYGGSERIPVIIRTSRMLVLLFFLSHLIACGWYEVGLLSGTNDVGNWQAKYGVHEMRMPDQYVLAFHFAASIFWGEHTLLPTNSSERLFTTMVLCFTFTIQIWFVSSITTAMTHLEIISTRRSTQFAVLLRFLSDKRISSDLCVRIKTNVTQKLQKIDRDAHEDHVELLQLISAPLMMDLHFEVHAPLLRRHPFFCCYNEANPAGIAKICHVTVSTVNVQRDDWIFQDLESPHDPRMLFVVDGCLTYQRENAEPESVTKQMWICEPVLWTNQWSHCGSLRAAADSKLLALDALKFQTIVALDASAIYPSSIYADTFIHRLNQVDASQISDIGPATHEIEDMLYGSLPDDWKRHLMLGALRTSTSRNSQLGQRLSHRLSRRSF